MQLRLTYTEVQGLISKKSGKELPMCFGGPHTLRISHKVPLMGSVGLDINVETIQGSNIYLSIGGGSAMQYMIKAALNQAKNQPGADMIEMLDNGQLLLALGKNQNTAQIFQNIDLQDIHFDEQAIMIDFAPKAF